MWDNNSRGKDIDLVGTITVHALVCECVRERNIEANQKRKSDPEAHYNHTHHHNHSHKQLRAHTQHATATSHNHSRTLEKPVCAALFGVRGGMCACACKCVRARVLRHVWTTVECASVQRVRPRLVYCFALLLVHAGQLLAGHGEVREQVSVVDLAGGVNSDGFAEAQLADQLCLVRRIHEPHLRGALLGDPGGERAKKMERLDQRKSGNNGDKATK